MKFKNIYNETKDNVESSMLSLWTPGRHRMRSALKDLFIREPIMTEPIFQSMFPWKTTNDPNWKQYLNTDVINRLHIGRAAGSQYDPYQHQTDSWRELQNGNSIVVTSGTGSGKTECFMYPVISDLYEQKQNGEDSAVEAIFLYPLNALMQDQKERLGKACEATGLRFAVYNSSLENAPFPPNNNYANAEVRSRKDVREPSNNNQIPSLPHILLTNPSMLEYMMVRSDDQPIFERSQGKLRWIIIDETHTYTGSAAVELAFLIKRVLNAFGVSRNDVRFVCTSATIGNPSQPQQLIDFVETIIDKYPAGSPKQLVHIKGDRLVPSITVHEIQNELNARHIVNTTATDVLSLRDEINRKPMGLGEIWQTLTPNPYMGHDTALELLDQLCDIQLNGNFVLMLRGHFFMRSISGLYSCVNHSCQNHTQFRNTGFEFLTTNKGDGYCPHCGAPLLEVVQCGACKEFMIMCEEDDTIGKIRFYGSEQSYDDSADDSNNDDDLTDGGQINDGWEKKYFAFYGGGRNYAKPHPVYMEFMLALKWDGNVLKSDSRDPNRPWVELRNNQNLYCPTCSSGSGSNGQRFKPFRLSSNWLNNTIAPALLLEGADANNVWGKYIAFTDSRQGTAIYAKRFNVESERAYARAHLVKKLSEPNVTELTIGEVADGIFNQQMFEHIDFDIRNRSINRRGNRHYTSDVDAYKTSLVRSIIGRRPVVANSSENLGLITLTYPAINNSHVQNQWATAGFSDTDWREFLKIAVDYLIRQGNHLQCPTYNERFYLRDGDNSSPFDPNDWPKVRIENNRVCIKQSRLVLLLCAALGIYDPAMLQNQTHIVDNLLQEAWQFLINKKVLTEIDNGDEYAYDSNNKGKYYINFSLGSSVCKIKLNKEAWICPVSNYLLDTTFRGYSPHIKGCLDANNINRFKCSNTPDITMPVYNPQITFEQWFLNNNEVCSMVQFGVWNDRHKYAYQPKDGGYLTVEHSGQQNRDLLAYYTNEFKAQPHRLNLLQCSTTMEMGVDIGDIDTVLMTNIPPTAANYLQRAGRAGRNGQSRSVAYSLCPNTPIGIQAFVNPMTFITSFNTVIPPLKSKIIIQRHVNSFFMHEFVYSQRVSTNSVEEWLMQGGISENFEDFLTNIVNDAVIRSKFAKIFGNTANYMTGMNQTRQRLGEIRNDYQTEHTALEAEYNGACVVNDQKKMTAIDIQLTALEEQKLKEYLSEKQYLPNANFPTGIVEFNFIDREQYDEIANLKTEIDVLNNNIANEQRPREKNRLIMQKKDKQSRIKDILEKTVTSREIKIALTEYAPDQEVVINERNLRTEGIEWKNSFNAGNPLKYLYYCRNCGRYEYSNNGNLTNCASCQSPLVNLLNPNQQPRFTLAIEPVRFRTDINRGNNIRENVEKQYYKCDTILTHVDWQNPVQGPLCELVGNGDGQGQIVYFNKGAGRGFKLCLDCGRMILEDNNNGVWTHKPLTDRSQANNNNCIARNVYHRVVLSGTFPTSYVSIRFKETSSPTSRYVNDEELMYSLGVVLRTALAHTIGVDIDEIDFGVRDEQNYQSLYIYDTMKGGCGYSTQMLDPHTCNMVFNEAKRMLSTYTCNCESNTQGACVHCLVDRNSQRYERKLSKYKVMSWFAGQSMSLTPSTIGDPAVPMTLKHLVTHEICNATVRRLTFCVDAKDMNVNDWISQDGIMGSLLHECVKRGKQVTIKVSNVPSVSKGNTLTEITPFVELPSKMQSYNVEAIDSLETQTGIYSALIVDSIQQSHYYVEQPDVLPFTEAWGDNCTALFSNQTIPQFNPSTFPTEADKDLLKRPTNYVRTGNVQDTTTTTGRFYNDVIRDMVLQPNDENDIRAILGRKRVNITFSDSYVNSALASLMLTYLIKSVKDLCDFEIGRIDLQFQATNRNCNNPRWNDYTYINLSFPDADEADHYTENQFKDILKVTPNFLSGIPDHYRWLRFQPEGESCYVEIRPDYGISGGWQSNRKYMDIEKLDGRTSIRTKDNTTVVYYVCVNKGK